MVIPVPCLQYLPLGLRSWMWHVEQPSLSSFVLPSASDFWCKGRGTPDYPFPSEAYLECFEGCKDHDIWNVGNRSRIGQNAMNLKACDSVEEAMNFPLYWSSLLVIEFVVKSRWTIHAMKTSQLLGCERVCPHPWWRDEASWAAPTMRKIKQLNIPEAAKYLKE